MQVDGLRQDESDDEDDAVRALSDLKKELLQFLANRDCLMLFPGFLSDVKVFCISVDTKLVGAHDFEKLLKAVEELHGIIHDLKRSRQVKLCKEIYETFIDRLETLGKVYPARAAEVIENERHEQVVRQTSMAVAAASFLVTIPLGGWGVAMGCAVRCAAAGTALGVGVVASSTAANASAEGSAERPDTLGGQLCQSAGRFGAVGAELANQRVVFNRTAASIQEGKVYEDTLLDRDGSPLYIGDFAGEVPHGSGRLFWKTTNFEAFIGRFKNGRPREGLFINEKGFCVARCQAHNPSEPLEEKEIRKEIHQFPQNTLRIYSYKGFERARGSPKASCRGDRGWGYLPEWRAAGRRELSDWPGTCISAKVMSYE